MLGFSLIALSSCEKTFDQLEKDSNRAVQVPASLVLQAVEFNVMNDNGRPFSAEARYNQFYCSNYNYYAFNTTMSNDSESSKYILPDYPYIVYYDKLLLTCIGYDDNNGLYSELDTTYTHPLLQGLISDSYDITYSYFLLGIDKDSSTKSLIIEKNNGSWILDNDAGVLTFYDRIDTATTVKQVSRSNAPRISFYRYEGLYGEANILNGQDL